MKLSIIVPIYNVEKYLRKCIDSILIQTFEEFELILVDDGSPDNCSKIIDEYAKKDTRIIPLHKQNGGLMSAWKMGVKYAKGEYIGFVDSDDWVDENMYKTLILRAEESEADLTCCGYVLDGEVNQEVKNEYRLYDGLLNRDDIEKKIFPCLLTSKKYKKRIVSPNRWNKLFKRTILLELLTYFDERVSIGEDLLTTFLYLNKCNSIYIINDFSPYHYRINNQSMIQKFDDSKYNKIIILKEDLIRANQSLSFDFSIQIYTDFTDLYLRTIESEILSQKKCLKETIKKRCNNEAFRESIEKSDKACFRMKNRIYLLLIKLKLYKTLILFRRII